MPEVVNIFALRKTQALKLLLLRLQERSPLTGLVALEPDHGQPDSIRLRDLRIKGLCAYIYTYGQGEDRYGADLEFPPQPGVTGAPIESYQEVALERLLDMLSVHFNLVDLAPEPGNCEL